MLRKLYGREIYDGLGGLDFIDVNTQWSYIFKYENYTVESIKARSCWRQEAELIIK